MQNATALERYMLTLVNQERTSRGMDALKLEVNLNQSAADHSQWMLDADVFAHTGRGGSSATERMQAADFDFTGSWRTAENVAWQSVRGASGLEDDVRDIHQRLMDSPGHRANILNPDLDYIGIGLEIGDFTTSDGRKYDSVMITQNFAATGGTPDLDHAPSTDFARNEIASTLQTTFTKQIGSLRDDVLRGGDNADFIRARNGDDVVYSGAGNDKIFLGRGDDTAMAGAGNDVIRLLGGSDSVNGGSGTDMMSYYDSATGVGIDLGTGRTFGAARDDTFTSIENAAGSNHADDFIYGSNGANTLRGHGADDLIQGRGGNDIIAGGAGSDRLEGNTGNDRLWGGDGADTFHFNRADDHDVIKDFRDNVDTLELDGFSFRSVSDALSMAQQAGDDVIFNFGNGDTLRIEDIWLGALGDDLALV